MLRSNFSSAPSGLPAARAPRRARASRLFVVDPESGRVAHRGIEDLVSFLRRGDCLVVNDAATLPASFRGVTEEGAEIEVRLAEPVARSGDAGRAVLFGAGDWRTPTERRAPPPRLAVGARIWFGARLSARVVSVEPAHPRWVTLGWAVSRADGAPPSDVLSEMLRVGRPVQYAYLARDLDLSEVQTGYASRPWSLEMPSAGRPLSFRLLLRAQAAGVVVASLTHAAGLSSTGDAALDARLPFPERYEIPEATIRAVAATRAAGGRVIAVGTTVVRALEDAGRAGLQAGARTTSLHIDRAFSRRVVDGILSGMHEPGASHFELLEAFASPAVLAQAHAHALAFGAEASAEGVGADQAGARDAPSPYLAHEFGDSCFILGGVLPAG